MGGRLASHVSQLQPLLSWVVLRWPRPRGNRATCSILVFTAAFGDAILLHVLWMFLARLNAVVYTVADASFIATIVSACCAVCMLGASMWDISLNSILLSLMIMVPGVTCAALSVQLLLVIEDTSPIEISMGTVFMIFAVWRLTVMVLPELPSDAPQDAVEDATAAVKTGPQWRYSAEMTDIATKVHFSMRALRVYKSSSDEDEDAGVRPTEEAALEMEAGAVTPDRAARPFATTPQSTDKMLPGWSGGDSRGLTPLSPAPAQPKSRRRLAELSDDAVIAQAGPTDDDEARRIKTFLAASSRGLGRPVAVAAPPAAVAPLPVPPPPAAHMAEYRTCRQRLACRRHAIPPWQECAAFLVAGSVAGVLGGLTGANGPPLMAVFSLLRTHKDRIRAVYVFYSLVEVSARFAVFGSEGGALLERYSTATLVAVGLTALLGFAVGSYLRRFVDSDSILRGLLTLVLASACMQVGVFNSAAVAAGVLVPLFLWLLGLVVVYEWRVRILAAADAPAGAAASGVIPDAEAPLAVGVSV